MKSFLFLIIFFSGPLLVIGQTTEPDTTMTQQQRDSLRLEQHPDSLESELFFSDPNVASDEVIVAEGEAEEQKHSPTKALLFSAVVPGLGQAYNKKYWKIPIVYAGLGVSVYFLQDNIKQINFYKSRGPAQSAGSGPEPFR